MNTPSPFNSLAGIVRTSLGAAALYAGIHYSEAPLPARAYLALWGVYSITGGITNIATNQPHCLIGYLGARKREQPFSEPSESSALEQLPLDSPLLDSGLFGVAPSLQPNADSLLESGLFRPAKRIYTSNGLLSSGLFP